MPLHRREFLKMAAGGVAGTLLAASSFAAGVRKGTIRAAAFDAFPIFDPRPVFALADTLFPGKGKALADVWRTRQFEYQWLRALSGRYVDFWRATNDALVFAARSLKLEMSHAQRDQLMNAYLNLKAWPDVPQALRSLRQSGIRLAFLSNMTAKMLETNMHNAGSTAFSST